MYKALCVIQIYFWSSLLVRCHCCKTKYYNLLNNNVLWLYCWFGNCTIFIFVLSSSRTWYDTILKIVFTSQPYGWTDFVVLLAVVRTLVRHTRLSGQYLGNYTCNSLQIFCTCILCSPKVCMGILGFDICMQLGLRDSTNDV